MVEALIVAGAILASAALLVYYNRESDEIKIRRVARTLVRAVEKRSEWDATITTEHIKRARVKLALSDQFPRMDEDWVDVVIEEAVFDMEADHERTSRSHLDFGRGADRIRSDRGGDSGADVTVAGDMWDTGDGRDVARGSDSISGNQIIGEDPDDSATAVEAS